MRRYVKVLSFLLAVFMVLATVPAMAENEKVEIRFCVGDEMLHINGEAVTVEKPYIVGEGVTLVPLRVITEAFGAEVEWIGETKTINLTYPDVNIVLQIDNPIAEVNGKAETLLSAPELTPNGFTMVPLRFISETFGAEVGYDEETRGITVVKETAGADEGTVIGAIEEGKIGDSYYGWSMDTPTDMVMTERIFDGTYTQFAYDEENMLDIDIFGISKDFDFEREFQQIKNDLRDLTLVKAEKDTKNPDCRSMHFQAKDKDCFWEQRLIVTKNYVFYVYGEFLNEQSEWRNEGSRLISTFVCDFPKEDVYDLSNVKDGMRTYTSENMEFSLSIPDEFVMVSNEAVENLLYFMPLDEEDTKSYIAFAIYSKEEVDDAKALAEKDFSNNKKRMNSALVTYSDGLSKRKCAGTDAYEYTDIWKIGEKVLYGKDVFFELGDYVYNVRGILAGNAATATVKLEKIINSVTAKQLDKDKVGILLRNTTDDEVKYTYKGDGFKMELPASFKEVSKGAFVDEINDVMLVVAVQDGDLSYIDIRKYMGETEEAVRKSGVEIIQTTKQTVLGGVTYADFTGVEEKDGEKIYTRQLVGSKGGKVFVIGIMCSEITYSEYTIEQTEAVVKSLKLN